MTDTLFYTMSLPGCVFGLTNQEKSINYSREEETENDADEYWEHPENNERGAFHIFDNFDGKNCD